MNQPLFPFTAVVGHSDVKQALLANAVDPSIGGLLIKGPRGTGKSTLARGLADVLPEQPVVSDCLFRCEPDSNWTDCPYCSTNTSDVQQESPPFVTLPLGATRDQVVGTIDLEATLADDQPTVDPGLLAKAHRGVLYVDEVNLLADHLVDTILDASASGWNRIERDAVSLKHPSGFTLIGTMNPEEGSLRPQLQDRFGLCVEASGLDDPARRSELVKRTEAFERSPEEFLNEYANRQQSLLSTVQKARQQLNEVSLTKDQRRRVSQRALEADVDGHRADIVVCRTARALAALDHRVDVDEDDITQALEWALEHRQSPNSGPPSPRRDENGQNCDSSHNGSPDSNNSLDTGNTTQYQEPDPAPDSDGSNEVSAQGKSMTRICRTASPRPGSSAESNHQFSPGDSMIAWSKRRARGQASPEFTAGDCRFRDYPQRPAIEMCLLDASGSMLDDRTLAAIKGFMHKRLNGSDHADRIGLIVFRQQQGRILLEPTRRLEKVRRTVDQIQAGGETPVYSGLKTTMNFIRNIRQHRPRTDIQVLLISDGRFQCESTIVHGFKAISERCNLMLIDANSDTVTWSALDPISQKIDCEYQRLFDPAA